ncbi:hypothetical protein Micbo1qcDRAFT_213521 [Microdochium bolleyi]|uniref:LYR motif-containing protein Cup1-like N-terminal domain-containing protein n=1 Tax=Microdochium bolleyi TaxID=196109 RepID=A0A136IW86_9PEZI|nr:hypothetical protein Micbo1qcDRAFT_213521 [Microdochium bolleyi]
MPPPIPHPETALHLYRHLLREATYLPALCRPWISDRIKTRYRDCREAESARADTYTRQAHGDLRYLRSATAGHVDRLLHLCYLATGRVGKRRRLLAKSGLARDPPASTASLEGESFLPDVSEDSKHKNGKENEPDRSEPALTQREHTRKKRDRHSRKTDLPPDWLDNWAVDKLTALARSQADKKLPHTITHDMRRTWDPEKNMSRENSWGLPIQARTERSRLRLGWARNFKALLPPLPRSEWESLEGLVNGRGRPEDYRLPRRRPVAKSTVVGDSGKDMHSSSPGPGITWQDIINTPVRRLQHGSSRKMKSLTGLDEMDQDPRGPGRPEGLRTLGGRKMRRMLYQPVWMASLTMEKHAVSGNFKVKWGQVSPTISSAAGKELPFFDGVETSGGRKSKSGAKQRGRGSRNS